MSYNYSIVKKSLDEITVDSFKEAIFESYKGGITFVAPLGFSGDTIMLHGKDRVSQVSIRNYSGDAELLITDTLGNFIFYGRFHVSMGVEFLAAEYFRIFTKVKKQIDKELPFRPDFTKVEKAAHCTSSEGFQLLHLFQKMNKKQK